MPGDNTLIYNNFFIEPKIKWAVLVKFETGLFMMLLPYQENNHLIYNDI